MNGGGSSASFVSRAVRKLALLDLPGLARPCEVDDRRDGRQVGVVQQDGAADADVGRDVPPVEDRVRKPVRAVDEDEVERARLPPREHLVGGADAERDGAGVDAELGAPSLIRSSSPASGVTASWTAPRAASTIVLDPEPVSRVDQPGSTLRVRATRAPPTRVPSTRRLRRPGGAVRSASVIGVPLTAPLCARPCRPVARRLRRRMARPRALITGVGGQDGSLLAALLLEQGYRVVGVVRRDPSAYAETLGLEGQVEIVEADLLDRAALAVARTTSPNEVYNLAAPSFVPRSWDEPILTAEFAAVGATSLLEAIREVDPSIRFYQASSSEIFGEPRETPQTEETPPSPLTPYGVAKAYAHFIAGSYRKRYGMFTCCGILYNHESPLRPVDFLPRKVARAAAAISLGLEDELVLGDLSARRDWGYAGDYVRAMWLMVQHDEPGDYIVATGVSRSVEELVAPSTRSGSPGASTSAPTRRSSGARRSSTTSSATRRRRAACSAGSRRASTSSSR